MARDGRALPPRPRASRMSRRRASVLLGVNVLIALHVVQWKLHGRTISPVEPSEAMQTLEAGRLNAGFLFFCAAIIATTLFGRFVCGWGCHVVALQDLAGAWLRRAGIRPRAFRSRILAWIPAALAIYMFVWPTVKREVLAPILARVWPAALEALGGARPFPGLSNHLVERDFWQTFPAVAVAVPFLLVCGFAVVYFLGSKGFCTYGCPYGAVFGVADRLSPGRVVVDRNACEHCGHCSAACTSNVRVHEEVREYGMVVDPGCMRCLDCVSVCPNNALRYAFTRPSAFKGAALHREPSRRYDLGLAEEIALGVLFAFSFFAFRGAYAHVPMLMAVGMALCVVFAGWTLWRLARRASVRVQNAHLKREGRWRPGGVAFAGLAVALLLLSAHTGWVNFHRWRAEQLDARVHVTREQAFSRNFVPDGTTRRRAEAALSHYARARDWREGGDGLLETEGIGLRMAWLQLVAGRPEEGAETLRGHLAERGMVDELAVDVGRMLQRAGRQDDAIAWYEETLKEHPGYLGVRGALVRMVGERHPDRAEKLCLEAVKASPDDPGPLALLGTFYLDYERYTDAETIFREAVRLAPENAAYHHDLAVALFFSDRPQLALEEMESAASLDPSDPTIEQHLNELRRSIGSDR